MPPTTYLITGANKGIGRGLLEAFLARPNSIVIAGIRDRRARVSEALTSIAAASGSKVVVIKMNSSLETDAKEAAELLKSAYGINKIDVIIANTWAGEQQGLSPETPIQKLHDYFKVDAIGSLALIQASWPLLMISSNPRFFVISSEGATTSMTRDMDVSLTAYGASNAAANYFTRKLHFESETLVAAMIYPGWTQTDLGQSSDDWVRIDEPPTMMKECVAGLIRQMDEATKENTSSYFDLYNDSVSPW